MSSIDRAVDLLADLLKDGAREAAQILVVTEGANIAWRTMQRAAESMGVVRSRPAYLGGWTWRLPVPEESPAQHPHPGRAAAIAQRLRGWEQRRGKMAPIHALDPRVCRWVAAGIGDPDLREAYERAVFALQGDGPLTVGHLDAFVCEMIAEGAKA